MECEGHSVPLRKLYNVLLPFSLACHANLETQQSNAAPDVSEAEAPAFALIEHLCKLDLTL